MRLGQPRVGVGPRRHQPREQSLAVAAQQRVAQHGPELVFPDARADGRLELGEHGVADPAVDREQRDLFRCLDFARVDRGGADVGDRDSFFLQRQESRRVDLVDRQALALEPELAQGRPDRARPLAGLVAGGGAAVLPGVGGAHVAHDLLGDVDRALVLEQDRRALGRHEAITREGPRRPHGHDVHAGRVADVGRVIEERDRKIVSLQHRLQPREPAGAELAEVDLAQVGHGELMDAGPRRHGRQHSAS